MTRHASARLAGAAYLFYILVAFPQLVIFGRTMNPEGTPARLAYIAEHALDLRIAILLGILCFFSAVALAVGLYGVTRDEDHELAVMALSLRVGEGVIGAAGVLIWFGPLWLATVTGPNAPDAGSANGVAALLLEAGNWHTLISAIFFAAGSTIFCSLLLRGRMIPVWLAWLGVIGSAVLVVSLPLELAGFLRGPITKLLWIPIAAFELTAGPWLLIKGVAPRAER
jgi:hypothetical protein